MLKFRGWEGSLQFHLLGCNFLSFDKPNWLACPPPYLDFLRYERIADAQREGASQGLSLVF